MFKSSSGVRLTSDEARTAVADGTDRFCFTGVVELDLGSTFG